MGLAVSFAGKVIGKNTSDLCHGFDLGFHFVVVFILNIAATHPHSFPTLLLIMLVLYNLSLAYNFTNFPFIYFLSSPSRM